MTNAQEFYAASVQEALDKAAVALNTEPEELEFEVVDEGSSGFLGIGSRDARIAVRVPQAPSEVTGDDALEDATEEEIESEEIESEEVESETAAPVVGADESDGSSGERDAPEDLLLAVDGLMTELIERIGFDGTVDAHDAGEVILVEVSIAQTGLFIGQKGETIDAVQYLLNLMVYRDRPFVKRIVVDTEGYRQRRVEAIQGMANRIARRAQRERRPVSLPPMSAAERRVVHLFLKENPSVSTFSEGQDENRRVIISPV